MSRRRQKFIGKKFEEIEKQSRWKLLFDDTYLVILETGVKRGYDVNLVGVSASDLTVKWELGGEIDSGDQYDGIVRVWIKNGEVWAGTWCGFAYQINAESGEILQTIWTK